MAKAENRRRFIKTTDDPVAVESALGPLKLLCGTWANKPNLPRRGWNMIALPFDKAKGRFRLLLNQYNETLEFSRVGRVDVDIPNRGLPEGGEADGDQFLAALDYEQMICQVDMVDRPESDKKGKEEDPIHHEPGLWLHIMNKTTDGLNIARLATIPHGNSVLALGRSTEDHTPEVPDIPDISGLPIGGIDRDSDLGKSYLEPYTYFHKRPFNGLFDPVFPNRLLQAANEGQKIRKITKLEVDTMNETGGIVNTPFIERQADATFMKSTFWIQELEEQDEAGKPKLRLQYSQVVYLDFFERPDGKEGLIRWPHVSINTMEKVSEGAKPPEK